MSIIQQTLQNMASDVRSTVALNARVGLFTFEDKTTIFPEYEYLADTPECQSKYEYLRDTPECQSKCEYLADTPEYQSKCEYLAEKSKASISNPKTLHNCRDVM